MAPYLVRACAVRAAGSTDTLQVLHESRRAFTHERGVAGGVTSVPRMHAAATPTLTGTGDWPRKAAAVAIAKRIIVLEGRLMDATKEYVPDEVRYVRHVQ